MSDAIHYIDTSDIQLLNSIPQDAVNITIDPSIELDKHHLLTSLANACSFPDYFSLNWDSAFDCLTDSKVENLKLDLTEVAKINTEDFNQFRSLMTDAFTDFGKPQLWVVVDNNNTKSEN